MGNEEKALLCPLTIKVFQAIARHLFVLTSRWITECVKQNQLVEEFTFEIRGDIPFGDYHDGMRHSRVTRHINLFENCQFFIFCHGCQDKMVSSHPRQGIEMRTNGWFCLLVENGTCLVDSALSWHASSDDSDHHTQ